MFQNDGRPKAKFTMWLHFYGRMLTTDRLIKWRINVEPRCGGLCKTNLRSRDHLYFSCNHILNLWVRLMQWIKRPMVTSQAQNNMQIEQFIIGKGDHTLLDFSERSSVKQSIRLDRQILENFQNKEKICRRVQSRKQPTFAMLELLRELNYYSNNCALIH